MRLDHIRAVLGENLPDNLDTLLTQWAGQGRDPTDLDGFVAWLREHDRIGEREFRELHSAESLVLRPLSTMAMGADPISVPLLDLADEATEEVSPEQRDATPLSPLRLERADPIQLGRFTMLGKLAEGAMGEVFIARDEALMRKVALKRMSARVAASRNLASRFTVEAQLTAQLAHPNIVPVYAFTTDSQGGTAYTMKLVNGDTFTELITEVRECWEAGRAPPERLALETRLEWFLRVCDALAFAHNHGVVHRDLKPDNIMVGDYGQVFVMDWGISRILDRDDDIDEDSPRIAGRHIHRTRLGTVIGTPAYMSPEQAEGNNDRVDARSDQFALGLMLHELVCGQKAFPGHDAIQLLLRVQQAKVEPMRPVHRRQPIPPELVAIVGRATQVEPDNRYASVSELADDVRRYLRGDPVDAMPEGVRRRISRWLGRHRDLTMILLLALLMLSASTVIGALLLNNRVQRAAEAREGRVSALLAATADEAHNTDTHLLELQGQLKVLAANAVDVLSIDPDRIGPEGDSYFLAEPFSPPDLVQSERYDRDVSLGWPVIKIADRLQAGDTLPSVRQVTLLRQPFRRLLLSSWSEDAVGASADEETRLLLQDGTPIAWAYVALENGVFAHYPGHQGFPPGHDAREEDWYQRVEDVRGPRWGTPHVDYGGLGLMLPCSMGLYDDDGLLLGVAGVELTFDYLLDQLLEPPELLSGVETYLLDADGRIVISSEDRRRASARSALGRKRVRLKTYEHRELLPALQERPSGVALTEAPSRRDRRLVVWSRMPSIGWTYVVEGDATTLLAR